MDYLSLQTLSEFYKKPITASLFEAYSLVGGVPRYWHLADKFSNASDFADQLYFSPNAMLIDKPLRLMYDEGLTGQTPKAILDLVGRGSRRPSEVAARIGVSQGSLGRPPPVTCVTSDATYFQKRADGPINGGRPLEFSLQV